jgi:hypothetical protein
MAARRGESVESCRTEPNRPRDLVREHLKPTPGGASPATPRFPARGVPQGRAGVRAGVLKKPSS